jgi:hypothetical protein
VNHWSSSVVTPAGDTVSACVRGSKSTLAVGHLGVAAHARYLADVDADGTITLTPARVIAAVEARFIESGVGARIAAELDAGTFQPLDLS